MEHIWHKLMKKHSNNNSENLNLNNISLLLRTKRKQLNMTQEELAKGVCSISYLSKIENNLVEVSNFYIYKLMEKLNVIDEYKKINDVNIDFKRFIITLANNDKQSILSYLENNNFEDQKSKLLILEYYFQTQDYINLRDLMLDCNMSKSSLVNDELLLFLYYSIKYRFIMGDFNDCVDLCRVALNVSYSNEYLKALTYNTILSIYFKLEMYDKYLSIKNNVNKLNYDLNLYNFILKRKIEKYYLKSTVKLEENINNLELLKYNPLYKERTYILDYFKAKAFILNKKYDEALEVINLIDNQNINENIYILKLFIWFKNQGRDISFYDPKYKFSSFKNSFIIFNDFIGILINNESKLIRKNKIKDNILPRSARFKDTVFDQIYYNYVNEILIETSRYKESWALKNKQNKFNKYNKNVV